MSRETWCDNCRKLIEELANVRREAVFAINKAQTERSEQIYDEGELSGYSRGVADTEVQRESDAEARLAKAQSDISNLRDYLYTELPTGEVDAFDLIKLIKGTIETLDKMGEALGEPSTKGEFRAYLRCKEPSEQCGKCEFLKQCKELNPQSDFCTKGEVKE